MQYIPPMGWTWKFTDFVFLERSFEKDKEVMVKQISKLGDYQDPIWLLLCPEGTRFSAKKHEVSQIYAQKNGLPILKHHLSPRTKGFTTSIEAMRGKFPAIYDIQVAFKKSDKVPPAITSILNGEKLYAHVYINRIPIEDIPTDEQECAQWLQNLFVVKDKMQDSFHNTGDFFKESGVKPTDSFKLTRNPFSLINTLFWNIVIVVPMFKWLITLLFSGELLYFGIACAILAAFYFVLQFFLGMSTISKGSTYGVK